MPISGLFGDSWLSPKRARVEGVARNPLEMVGYVGDQTNKQSAMADSINHLYVYKLYF